MKRGEKPKILIADASKANRSALREILEGQYQIQEALEAEEALEAFRQEAPSLALIGSLGPEAGGLRLLAAMSRDPRIGPIPALMIAEEAAASYIEQAYELGAADFIPLPFHPAVVRQRAANAVALYESQGLLAGMSQERARQNAMMADILGHIVEFRNQESRHHILNVHMLTELLLRRLAGSTDRYRLSEDDISLISTVSAFHDIGKIAIPTEILNKPGRLTREEFEVMKTHSRIGGRILRQLPAYQEEPFVKLAYQICRWHHERYDGGGYPDGLKGEEIPIAAQVVAAADVYDALTSERVYKKAVPQEEAVWMIENGMCGAFQPLLLKCLGGAVRELPAAFKGLAAKMPGHGCAGAGRERALTV